MNIRAIAKIKINTTPEIVKTIKIYGKGLQFCINTTWNKKIRNNIKLHPFVYKKLRKLGLQSQLAIACIKQACGMIKRARSKPIINKVSMRYSFTRSASLKNNVLSIATIKGRQKFNINIPKYFKEYFNSWKLNESLLRINKKGRCFFLFCFSKEININCSDIHKRVLGIDLGINNIAVTSDKIFFNAGQIKLKRIKFQRLRSKLQAKGTRSSRRLLKKISGREKRFMVYWNHAISKQIVNNYKVGTIILESLRGVRNVNRGKKVNFWLHSWSFYQLQSFIKYKAIRKGIKVIKVSPYHTSQKCSNCGNIGSRSKSFFHCKHCGYSLNADLNASFNLAKHHSISDGVSDAVIHPNIQVDEHKGSSRTIEYETMDKSPHL